MLSGFTSFNQGSAAKDTVSAFSVLQRTLMKVGFNINLSNFLSALIGAFDRVLSTFPAVVSGNELMGTFLATELANE